MSLRILLGIALAAAGGTAQASSLIFPGAPASTPSVLLLQAAAADKASDGQSVVALGEPDVTYEKVAAIPHAPAARHGFTQSPMIIRGGVAGGAFSTPASGQAPAAAAVPATATASAAPAAGEQQKKTTPAAAAPAPVAQEPAPGVGQVK
ncbi:hypothetical protein [Mesorhizobium sp. M0488]|uniref:hypothetical protein n=1 Tax=unclassified Mesorhizobium TaxID=325217 RepID=UPI00333DF39E